MAAVSDGSLRMTATGDGESASGLLHPQTIALTHTAKQATLT
ncbi:MULTISPECIES: hypothetical protein [unclassified Caballeronia]|nr:MULTISPECIES: hypothetical protein [unclassified Caballeronia]